MISTNEFTKAFLQALHSEIEDATFTIVSELKIHTKDVGGYELNIFLDNAYARYSSGQRQLELVFADQINSIKSQQITLSHSDIKSILPVIKPISYIETIKKQLKDAGYNPAQLPFYVDILNDDMYIMYAFDLPDSMRFVSSEDIEEYQIETSMRSIATRNLEKYYHKLGAQIQQIDTQGIGAVYLFVADENYEASVLLSPLVLDKRTISIKGEIVVFVPARNIALIVGSEDIEGIRIASNLAARGYSELGYAISPYGYIQCQGNWKRYEP